MTCAEVGDVLAAYGDHELPGSTMRLVDEHLAGCAACRATLARQAALDSRLALLRASVPAPAIAGEVMRRLGNVDVRPATPAAPGARLRPLAIAVAALVVLALTMAVLSQPGRRAAAPPAPTAQPSVYLLRSEPQPGIAVLDPATFEIKADVVVGANPRAMTLSGDGRWLYVAAALPGVTTEGQTGLALSGVWVIDLTTSTVSRTLPAGYAVWDVASVSRSDRLLLSYQPTGRYLRPAGPGPEYETVERTPGQVLELDTATGKLAPLADLRPLARGLAVTDDGKLAYVVSHDNVSYDDTAVTVLDVAKRRIVKTIVLPGVEAIAAAPDGQRVFVSAAAEPYLWTIDRTGERLTAFRYSSLPSGSTVKDLAISPNGLLLALAIAGPGGQGGGLIVLDTRRLDTLLSLPSTDGYQALAFSPDSTRLYAATATGRLDVMSVPRGQLIATVHGLGNMLKVMVK